MSEIKAMGSDIFITALALIILSAVFFVFELLVGHYKLHLTLLNNNLPFIVEEADGTM